MTPKRIAELREMAFVRSFWHEMHGHYTEMLDEIERLRDLLAPALNQTHAAFYDGAYTKPSERSWRCRRCEWSFGLGSYTADQYADMATAHAAHVAEILDGAK